MKYDSDSNPRENEFQHKPKQVYVHCRLQGASSSEGMRSGWKRRSVLSAGFLFHQITLPTREAPWSRGRT